MFCHPEEIAGRVCVNDADNVLDLGCGAGRISIPVAKLLSKQGSLLGVDLQEGMISRALIYAERESLSEVCSFKKLNILEQDVEGIFDKIIIVTVLGEIPNIDQLMRKIYSMLSEDGTVSVTEVIPDPCYISKARLKGLFEKHDFKATKLYSGPLSYTMNFSKC
jgi:2-polyprenyl-3-methyl-5-hydroxy-6-metoxy-1,4-benzoquinol methylase